MPLTQPARSGSSLLMAMLILVSLSGLAVVAGELSIGSYKERQLSKRTVSVRATAESVANVALAWVKNAGVTVIEPQIIAKTVRNSMVFPTSPAEYLDIGPEIGIWASTANDTALSELQGRDRLNASSMDVRLTRKSLGPGGVATKLNDGDQLVIFATGRWAGGNAINEAHAERVTTVLTVSRPSSTNPQSIFRQALFAKSGYTYGGAATTDAWDSRYKLTTTGMPVASDAMGTASYAAFIARKDALQAKASRTAAEEAELANLLSIYDNGDLSSNGKIVVDTPSNVKGTAYSNVGLVLPAVTYVPPVAVAAVAITTNTTITGTGGTQNLRVTAVNMKNNNVLTIGGTGEVHLWVDGAFNVGDLKFAIGSTAKLVIHQNVTTAASSLGNANCVVGDPANPSRLIWNSGYTGDDMKLNGGNNFSAVVYAPNAGIQFNGNSNFYGSVVADNYSNKVNGTFSFHFDNALTELPYTSDVVVSDPPVYAISTWAITPAGLATP